MSVTDEIKAQLDIVDFISRYVPLQRSGRSFKACCPFHQERTPSFVIFPESGLWHCFGACSTGGDIFSFLMQKEKMSFREALEMLAAEAGVQLPNETEDDNIQERTLLYELNAKAALFFQNQLHRSPAAQMARAYLQQRGIGTPIARQFQLGFAPDSWDALYTHLEQEGYRPDSLHRAGLLKHNEERNSFYDAFRNRLMIPIHDRQGRTIGFGGRVLDDSLPKYLNTAETELFHKSQVLYGLERAYQAIRQAQCVVIVEGYMDVIAAHQFGFEHVIACLGTALTAEQLRQLQHYTNTFILALDADAAGQQATIRGLNQARQALKRKAKPVLTSTGRTQIEHRITANLRITALPAGRDPDEIIRQDPQVWQELLNNATPLVDYYFGIVSSQYDLHSAQGKGEAVAELTPLIAELNDEIERQHYSRQLSRLVQIDQRMIDQRVQAAARVLQRPAGENRYRRRFTQPQNGQAPAGNGYPRPHTAAQEVPSNGTTGRPTSLAVPAVETKLESFLLAHLLYDPDLLVGLAKTTKELEIAPLQSKDFHQLEYREIFEALRRFIASDEVWEVEAFQETLSANLHVILSDLMAQVLAMPERERTEIQDALLKLLIRLRRDRLRENLSTMQFLLHDAQENDDQETISGSSAAIDANRRDRHHLERVLLRRSQVSYGVTHVESGMLLV